jgi:signal transduction histidine kinase
LALKVEDVMSRSVITVESDASAKSASQIMELNGISSLVVVCNGDLVGILTEKDLVVRVLARALDPERTRVLDVMTKVVVTVNSNDPLEKAVQIMLSNGIKKLPVLEESGPTLVGILSQTDIAILYPDLYAKAMVGRAAAQIGHDLRGPLNTIVNATFIIEHHPEKIDFGINSIKKAVESSTQILDEMKSKTSETLLNKVDVNLNDFVSSVLDAMALPGIIELERNLTSDVHVSIDNSKMKRVLDNLIRNSVEAMTGCGLIWVSTKADDEWATIEIRDNGCGIPDEIMQNLYSPFVTSKKNGTGLGLSFSKRIVDAHKGDIKIESETGVGTNITIRLPISSQ